ncbi:hypothetical protein RvY_04124-2 [Ramazzottius varieornatus]|nr:hypothetical protein RvY_04124-2 [Ramazzottius varieornatus]
MENATKNTLIHGSENLSYLKSWKANSDRILFGTLGRMNDEKSWGKDESYSTERHADTDEPPSAKLDYLNTLAYASLSVSILGLIGTLYIILCANPWVCSERPVLRRITDNDFVLVNLAVALVLFHASYLAGLHSMSNDNSCLVAGLLVHFFWLASFIWEAAEGYLLFNAFLKFGKSFTRFKLKSFLACWGISVLIVSTSLLINAKAYIGDP